jgi:hypothetical protein
MHSTGKTYVSGVPGPEQRARHSSRPIASTSKAARRCWRPSASIAPIGVEPNGQVEAAEPGGRGPLMQNGQDHEGSTVLEPTDGVGEPGSRQSDESGQGQGERPQACRYVVPSANRRGR